MPFEKGNQEGKKSKARKPFADMLRIAIAEAGRHPKSTKMRDVAEALVDEAIKGNVAAIKELGDRLDGKVIQQVGGPDDDEGKPTDLRLLIVDPRS